jgi:hypothetical protein
LDGAIGHFSHAQLDILLPRIKNCLGDRGILTGYEEIESPESQSWDHLIALESEKDFMALLERYFKNVRTFYGESPGRRNVYFRCSDNEKRLKRFRPSSYGTMKEETEHV